MAEIINCLGEFCPIPSIKTKYAYKNLKTGHILKVITDHSCAPSNIKEVLANKSCNIKVEEIERGIWEITIEKLD